VSNSATVALDSFALTSAEWLFIKALLYERRKSLYRRRSELYSISESFLSDGDKELIFMNIINN
jgi:hypothetical protein